jgi:IclR family acetate operon transcriptional repressor
MAHRTGRAAEVTVKSSLRTLELLEFCDRLRRPVTVGEIVSGLGYPQSSASTLVQSLINGGYLMLAADGRSVLPTSRVSALGRWVDEGDPVPAIKALMAEIGEETGQTVLLGIPSDLCVRYIEVVPGRHPMRLAIPVGARLPLVASGLGTVLLAQMADESVLSLLDATRERLARGGVVAVGTSELPDLWNARPDLPSPDDLMRSVEEARREGFALSLGRATMGAGIVCVGIPAAGSGPLMGLGVGGLSAMIERDHLSILASIRERAAAGGVTLARATGRTSQPARPDPQARRSR